MSDEIARNIKYYRKKAKMSQGVLAKLADVSLMSIRRYETEGNDNREPNFVTLSKIAEALGVSIIELANEEVKDYPDFLKERVREISRARIDDYVENLTDDKKRLIDNYDELMGDVHDYYSYTIKKRKKIIEYFSLLNDKGQDKAIEHVEMLTKIPEYRNEEE